MKLKNNTVPKSKVAKSGKAPKNGQTEIFETHDSENSDANTLNDWEYCQLEDVVKKGSSNISLNKIKGEDGEYPVFAAKGFVQNVSFYHQEEDYLAIIKDGAGIGRVTKHPAKSSIVATMQYLIPKKGFDIDFIKYFLEGIDFGKHRNGSTIPHIYFKDYKSEKFPKISLPEQKRIVSILDQAFAAVDKAKANAERNLQNAKALFESYLQGVFEKKGENWETKKLGGLSRKIMTGPFGSMLHKSDYVEYGIPVVNPQNLVGGKIISLSKTMISRDTFERLRRFALKAGDIVIARRGEMGRCGIVREENVNWLCGTGSFVIRTNANKVDSEFLNILLSSNIVKEKLEKVSIGATMSNLNQTILSGLSISIPDLDQQKNIVHQLDALRAETQKLETFYQTKINHLEELKKSILQKAFKGELTQAKHYDLQEDSFSLVAEPEPGEIPKG